MKRVSLLAISLLAALPAASVDSARPPYLLTYSLQHQHRGAFPAAGRGLCIARADGSRALRLTAPKDDRHSAWSPNGRFVAFARQYNDERFVLEILLADVRGRVIRNLSQRTGTFNDEPTWSPDSRHVAFSASWRESSIYIVERLGGRPRNLPVGSAASGPAWAPDGRRLAYTSFQPLPARTPPAIFTIKVDGSERRLLIENAFDAAWSPDGSSLAFRRPVSGTTDIWLADADGSNARPLTTTRDEEFKPAWSPDGKLIAFERRLAEEKNDRHWITVVEAATGRERVSFRRRYGVHDPSWRAAVALPKARRTACR